MDISTYDQAEKQAQARLSSWRFQQVFSPLAFDQVGFPARLHNIGQMRGLLAGMHDWRVISYLVAALGGLRDEDFNRLGGAVATYLNWFRTVFADEDVPIPLGDLIAYYLVYQKLSGIENRQRVLEIGPGYGLLALFLHSDKNIRQFDMIEITQSLYVTQASLCASCYRSSFRNAALAADQPAQVGRRGGTASVIDRHRPFSLGIPRKFSCTLFPWWELDEALGRQYDVITSNANLVEMSPAALDYYLENWPKMLSKSGYVLIQDLGHSVHRSTTEVEQALDGFGYRALAKFVGDPEQQKRHMLNLLLVTEGHPDYDVARPVLEPHVMLTDHETVRRVYGLDRARGESLKPLEILERIAAKLGGRKGGG